MLQLRTWYRRVKLAQKGASMKGAPLRIQRHENQVHLGAAGRGTKDRAGWVEEITKLIPGEAVAAYLSGRVLLRGSNPPLGVGWWIAWTLLGLVLVVGLRRWMTSDKTSAVPAEWSAVCTSAISFVVWVYSFGDVFQMLGVWNSAGSGLVLIAWTTGAPLVLLGFRKLFGE